MTKAKKRSVVPIKGNHLTTRYNKAITGFIKTKREKNLAGGQGGKRKKRNRIRGLRAETARCGPRKFTRTASHAMVPEPKRRQTSQSLPRDAQGR